MADKITVSTYDKDAIDALLTTAKSECKPKEILGGTLTSIPLSSVSEYRILFLTGSDSTTSSNESIVILKPEMLYNTSIKIIFPICLNTSIITVSFHKDENDNIVWETSDSSTYIVIDVSGLRK